MIAPKQKYPKLEYSKRMEELCFAQALFCHFHVVFEGVALAGGGEADGEGEWLGSVFFIVSGELVMDAGEDDLRCGGIDLGQEDGELVAAVAADDVFGAEGPGQQAGSSDDALVAGFIAVLFVVGFETGDLGGEDGDGEEA